MRIVSGEWGGRLLVAPKGTATRPTQDRVRQILFDILGSRVAAGPFLDLYAGTGAIGLEALSRGAPFAVFVEASARARGALEANRNTLGAADRSRVIGGGVTVALARLADAGEPFAWVVADPPYDGSEEVTLLRLLGERAPDLLLPGGGFVLETRRERTLPPQAGHLVLARTRAAGGTMLHFFELQEVSA